MRVLLMHLYSSTNSGDGLLAREALELAFDAFGDDVQIDALALDAKSFDGERRWTVYPIRPFSHGWRKTVARLCLHRQDYDLILGVGGGYLRFGRIDEGFKSLLAHVPQLALAASSSVPTVYLPQSIGPLKYSRGLIRCLLSRVDTVLLRDARSLDELKLANASRLPDTALLSPAYRMLKSDVGEIDTVPIIGTRSLSPSARHSVRRLSEMFGTRDGLVQSCAYGNDDSEFVADLGCRRVLNSDELARSARNRVVISVRLHGALMALNAGNFVIHLAYERKGFGAFEDLGLESYVHDVNHFDPALVFHQAQELINSGSARRRYASEVNRRRCRFAKDRDALVNLIREKAAQGGDREEGS